MMKHGLQLRNGKAALGAVFAALLAVGFVGLPQRASAIGSGDADTMFNGFNNSFLVSGSYYKSALNNGNFDGGWTGALDIMVAEDAYERTGSSSHQALVNTLCTTFLQKFPPGYTWDGWNDDIGWMAIMLARGYRATGNSNLLTQARTACFDMAWARGWDTQYNGGGIWEQQPDMTPAGQPINKNVLSNDSLGKAACYIYQGNHDQWYLDRATQIYAWVRSHLYNTSTGQVYTSIDRSNNVDTSTALYSVGTFVDYANLLYQITGNVMYYNDAKRSIDYAKNNMYNSGVITGGGTNTWSDEFARGIGHFCRDNRMWGTYLSWMQLNANAIMSHRRTDLNLCWGNFSQQTPNNGAMTTNAACDAAAWLQYTPVSMPNSIWGRHVITNSLNGIAIDSGGNFGTPGTVILWGLNSGLNQMWDFSQNSDTSWNIISEATGEPLEDPGGNTTNGTHADMWTWDHGANQRWWVDVQPDGTYKIWNQASSLALDSGSASANNSPLLLWGWNNQIQQRWVIH